LIGPLFPPTGLPLVPHEDSDDDEVVEVYGSITPASRKRRSYKMKEPLEASFPHCSRRLNPDLGGYRDHASDETATDLHVVTDPQEIVGDLIADNPAAYAATLMEASSSTASHLSLANIYGMATGFL
jgi:hypothetical protein